jgi:ABC-type nitrate/sulfonate/bicarbonate transport system permease component
MARTGVAAGAAISRGGFRIPGFVRRSASVVFLLLVWEGVARAGWVDPFLLPALSDVLIRGFFEIKEGGLIWFAAITLYRTLFAFAIASAVGVGIGVAMSVSKGARWFWDPIVSFAFPIPKIALLPIFVLWFGVFDVSKISMTAVACVVPIISATHLGTRNIDKYLIWSARALGTSQRKLFWKIVVPAALPSILTGLQIAFPITLIVSIVCEMLTGGQGLGGYMIYAARFGESDKVFLGIFFTAVIGYVLIEGFAWLRRRLLAWHAETASPV